MALPHLVSDACTDAIRRLDPVEVEILQFRGAFDLPPKEVQDELVDLFFLWVVPILPIINKKDFLVRYHNPVNPPSLLLLQAIFLSVSRVSRKIESSGEYDATTRMFVQRAKALYDAGYEQDPVTVVQSLILMSWYWHGPQDATENGLFYWSRLAIAVAQENDMHISDELPHLTRPERRLWKRIWWTLFTRDRAVSAAYGRPLSISLQDSSVEELVEDDFVDDDQDPPNIKHVQFFLQYTKLCKILELVACGPIKKREHQVVRMECEYELNKWLSNCPEEMQWQQSLHEFWAAVLHYTYNTILCQLYGLQSIKINPTFSQTVVSEAASMILSTIECLVSHDEIKYAPPSVLYSIFTILVTTKDQLSSAIPSLVLQSRRKVKTCIRILGALSQTWPIARMLSETSELIFSEKRFNEMLESSSHGSKRKAEGEIITTRRIFKRSLLNPKHARPELLLPRSRIILRMALTNRSSQENLLKSKLSPQSDLSYPQPRDLSAVCDSATQTTLECTDPDLLLPLTIAEVDNTVCNHRTKASDSFATHHREICELDEYGAAELTIPLFERELEGVIFDQPAADAAPTVQREELRDGAQETSQLAEELLLPASLDFDEWSLFLEEADLF